MRFYNSQKFNKKICPCGVHSYPIRVITVVKMLWTQGRNLCDLTNSDLKVHALHYANGKGKKDWVPVLVGKLEPFFNGHSSLSRQIRHFFNARGHERALMTP